MEQNNQNLTGNGINEPLLSTVQEQSTQAIPSVTKIPISSFQEQTVQSAPESNTAPVRKKKTGLIVALILAAVLLVSTFCVWYFLIRIPPVEHITLSETTIEFAIGEEKQLSYTIMPEKANKKEVFWKSTNDSVATVDGNGKIIAKGIGVCTITVSVENQTASVEVIVLKPELSESEILLGQGEEHMLVCSIYPESVKNKTVEWKSSDESIATVGQNGVVQAKECGQCTVTASVDNQSVTAEVIVMKIELSDNSLSLWREAKHTLNCMIYPESLQDQTIEWTSSDDRVATVDQSGTITAVGSGMCMITASVDNQSAVVQVKVLDVNEEEYLVLGKWPGKAVSFNDQLAILSDPLYLNDDLTGSFKVVDNEVSFTWKYDETDDDGNIWFDVYVSGASKVFTIIYQPKDNYLVLILDISSEAALFYERN